MTGYQISILLAQTVILMSIITLIVAIKELVTAVKEQNKLLESIYKSRGERPSVLLEEIKKRVGNG